MNQRILFSNVTREERELKIKLQKYGEEIESPKISEDRREMLTFAYDTLLFNYYEFVAICIYKKMINENDGRLYFRDLVVSVKKVFDSSDLFSKEISNKKEYCGILWLFKRGDI